MGTSPAGESRYDQRGVSSDKTDVHAAIRDQDKGLFPGAFCKIFPDDRGDPRMCIIPHADGAGTKSGLAYLYWKTVLMSSTADLRVFHDIVQDSIVMNVDDTACVGASGVMTLTSSIERNKFRIPGEVVAALIEGGEKCCEWLRGEGIEVYLRAGETADTPDGTRTLSVNNSLFTSMRRADVIDAGRVDPNAHIVGFGSAGQAAWEDRPNSGIRSNGLTNARHETLSPAYRKYRETFAPELAPKLRYSGTFNLDDPLPGAPEFTIGTALLSPTRSYAPLIRRILEAVDRNRIPAFFHNSGGGLTKCKNFGREDVVYVKEDLLPVPPLFMTLHHVQGMSWRDMCTSYNVGIGLEMVTTSRTVADEAIRISRSVGIPADYIGRTRARTSSDDPRLRVAIRTPDGVFENYKF